LENPVAVESTIDQPIVEETVLENPIVVESTIDQPIVEIPIVVLPKYPDIVFIVPYRDRVLEKELFILKMEQLLDNETKQNSKIFFIEQYDMRSFNRGAMKNIGFLLVKQLYPDNYKDITLVFNDVDTTPAKTGLLNYKTTHGIIKHFYGYTFTLGGIVSITGQDFEKINGFPNYWAWGFEDNLLNKRAIQARLHIDRSQFFSINDKDNITQNQGTILKQVNKGEFDRYVRQVPEGITSIKDLQYNILPSSSTEFINHVFIKHFLTEYTEDKSKEKVHDIRNGAAPFNVGYSGKKRATMSMII
jgi:hypothetical protein